MRYKKKRKEDFAYSVVPNSNRVDLPFEANLEVGVFTDLTEEEGQDGI